MGEIIQVPGWVSYLRVSDEDKQTPERSFAMQRKSIRDHLLDKSEIGFNREYVDMLTGTSPNRADYQQMLADAEAGKFSHLALYRADRFGRNAVEGLQAATRLISLGVKVRVANMPTLQPETPDGFFMFLLQMGLAQREVDVLRERTRDGMEIKLRAGGWPQRAPEGYVNKERQVSSNKYERWVEIDPESSQVLRQAWDLLLSGRYTLNQICEELHAKGHTRESGRPWVWTDKQNGQKKTAANRLHKIFHNPFYAGWVVSERFDIKQGEIRGQWEPIISEHEYQQGVEILRRNDQHKARTKRHHYLLRNIVYVRVDGSDYKLYGSTPSGRSKSYSYYVTHAKPRGGKQRFPTSALEEAVGNWLNGIQVDKIIVPKIQAVYAAQVEEYTTRDRDQEITELRRNLGQLREEEARLGRLLITGKITEETFDQLRAEWQDKLRHAELSLAELERDTHSHISDLDKALALLDGLVDYYFWLGTKDQSALLQIIIKRIVVGQSGKIVDYELNSPFVYLRRIANNIMADQEINGSGSFSEGTPSFSRNHKLNRILPPIN